MSETKRAMTEALALKALAQAQKAMLDLVKDNLNADFPEGLRTSKHCSVLFEFYNKLREEWLSHDLISDAEAKEADQIMGYQ